MARGRELSQLGSLITVDDSTKNIGVATATPSQKIGIGTLSPTSKVEVVGDVLVSGIVTTTELSLSNTSTANRKALVGSWTAVAGILTSIDTITISDFKTIEYTLHIENSVGIQAQKVLVSRSGTTPYSQEYAIMYSSDLLVSIGSSYTGGNYYLNATPETGISGVTTYNFVREIINNSGSARLFYEWIVKAKNVKLVFLSGTPIINKPSEIAILYNMLQGEISIYQFTIQSNRDPVDITTELNKIIYSKFRVH